MALKFNYDEAYFYLKTIAQMSTAQYNFVRQFLEGFGAEYNPELYTWRVRHQHLDAVLERLEDITVFDEPIENVKGIIENLTPEFPIIDLFLDELKLEPFPYQKIGISFLVHQKKAIVGDVMGLGKTIQAIGAAHILHRQGHIQKVLVICPASLKYQWGNEVEKFTDYSSLVIDGTTKKREKLYKQYEDEGIMYCLVNYELVRNDLDILKRMDFDVIVVDEAHRIKNRSSQTYKALIQLDAPYKFALTGTPMQNRPEEIHALMSWIDKTALGPITKFRERHIVTGTKFGRRFVPLGAKRLGEIRRNIAPFMVRRTKEEVAPDLPPLIESQYYVDLNKEQREIMSNIHELVQSFSQEVEAYFKENPEATTHPKENQVMGFLGMMISASDHPKLLTLSDSQMAQKVGRPGKKAMTSPKLEALIELSREQIDNGNKKIVVFTQFARMKKLIEERLTLEFGEQAIAQGIDGSMKALDRQKSLVDFQFNADRIFFVCTDAANYGINISYAGALFNYDLPWNPSIRAQRNGRIHRIDGQLERYNIIDLISNDSIDEIIWSVIQKKEKLGEKIVGKNKQEQESMRQLMRLLK